MIIDTYIYNLYIDFFSKYLNPFKLNNTIDSSYLSNQDDFSAIDFEEIFNGVFSVYFLGLIISITVLIIEVIIQIVI